MALESAFPAEPDRQYGIGCRMETAGTATQIEHPGAGGEIAQNFVHEVYFRCEPIF